MYVFLEWPSYIYCPWALNESVNITAMNIEISLCFNAINRLWELFVRLTISHILWWHFGYTCSVYIILLEEGSSVCPSFFQICICPSIHPLWKAVSCPFSGIWQCELLFHLDFGKKGFLWKTKVILWKKLSIVFTDVFQLFIFKITNSLVWWYFNGDRQIAVC